MLLDNQFGYCFCTGVLQARVMSPNLQYRANRLRRQGFSGRYSLCPYVFKGHPMNLYRGHSGYDCVHPLNLDYNRGGSWDDCGHSHWDILWNRYCLFRG